MIDCESVPNYASVDQVEAGFRVMGEDERKQCEALIIEASVLVDSVAKSATPLQKQIAVCRMVRRAIGSGVDATPIGSTQGSVSALGYSQSWTMGSSGSVGEMYIGKTERTILGMSNKIGASNPYSCGGGAE